MVVHGEEDQDWGLNEQQRLVVEDRQGGAVLVLAGAGSGKTHTLTCRVAHLLKSGCTPWSILLLTFTNKAAREMLDRVCGLVGPIGRDVEGGTFHGFAHRLLRIHAEDVGLDPSFSVLDRSDSVALIKRALDAEVGRRRGEELPSPQVIASILGFAAGCMRSVGDVITERFPMVLEEHVDLVERVGVRYAAMKREENGLDFDDLLVFLLRLLEDTEGLGARYSDRFEHVLVDEFQDTNPNQFAILRALTRVHGNLTAVGDDAQSIYSWRGAALENLLEFEARFPDARVFRVEWNYRSQPGILDLANCSIALNRAQLPKILRPVREYDTSPLLVHTWDLKDQARFLVERIQALATDGVAYGRMAVLFRSHFQSVDAQMALRKAGVPFVVVSGIRFFELAHVRDLLAFIRWAAGPEDRSAFLHLAGKLPRVGEKTALRLWSWLGEQSGPLPERMAAIQSKAPEPARPGWEAWTELTQVLMAQGGIPERMVQVVLDSGYQSHLEMTYKDAANRIQDLKQLAQFASGFDSVDVMLGELALMSNVEADATPEEGQETAVWMGTVHQAKGLEWDHVFVIGLNEGVWPTGHAIAGGDAMLEEERRLFYVAMTRARDGLYLLVPGHRLARGSWEPEALEPSRYIEELDPDLLEKVRFVPEDAFPMDY